MRHQSALARIAGESGVRAAVLPADGQIIRLGPGIHEVVAEIPAGRIGLDGKILRRLDRETVKHRRKLGFNGAAVVTVALDQRGRLMSDAHVTLLGIEDEQYIKPLRNDLTHAVMDAVEGMSKAARTDDGAVRGAIVQAARRFLHESHGKKPVIEVHVVRV
jgi:ribonuclease J